MQMFKKFINYFDKILFSLSIDNIIIINYKKPKP